MDTKIGIVRQICSARHVFCQWLCAGAATDVGCGSPAAKIVAALISRNLRRVVIGLNWIAPVGLGLALCLASWPLNAVFFHFV